MKILIIDDDPISVKLTRRARSSSAVRSDPSLRCAAQAVHE
jgi:hypothetical protein